PRLPLSHSVILSITRWRLLYSKAHPLSRDNQQTSAPVLRPFVNQVCFLASRLQRRPSIRIAFVIIVLVAAAAVVIGDFVRSAAARRLREAILAELQPVALKNCALKRFGSANDGGYLMCENLIEPLDAAYSYGVGRNDDWGCELSRRYHVTVHQYDCFDPARPTCTGGAFVFHNECVGDQTGYRKSRFFDTLEDHIRRNGDTGRHLIIKMDIEGGEWDSLLAAPDEVLASIPQITMEMHGFDDPKIVEVLRKLKRIFYFVILHFLYWSCKH